MSFTTKDEKDSAKEIEEEEVEVETEVMTSQVRFFFRIEKERENRMREEMQHQQKGKKDLPTRREKHQHEITYREVHPVWTCLLGI
jgi:predicted glutamine amidotransferase